MFAITYDMLVFGRRRTGTYELDLDRMTRSQIVSDIVSGQFENVDRVIEYSPAEGTCQDITVDIAQAVYSQIAEQGDRCPEFLRGWLSEHRDLLAPNRLDLLSGEVDPAECAA